MMRLKKSEEDATKFPSHSASQSDRQTALQRRLRTNDKLLQEEAAARTGGPLGCSRGAMRRWKKLEEFMFSVLVLVSRNGF